MCVLLVDSRHYRNNRRSFSFKSIFNQYAKPVGEVGNILVSFGKLQELQGSSNVSSKFQ